MRLWTIGLLAACMLVSSCGKETDAPKDAVAMTAPPAALEGPYCGTNALLEYRAFEAKKEMLRAHVKEAIAACELITDSEHGQDIRGDAKKVLQRILVDLEKLDASIPRTGPAD